MRFSELDDKEMAALQSWYAMTPSADALNIDLNTRARCDEFDALFVRTRSVDQG
jgi:hypothetical protein